MTVLLSDTWSSGTTWSTTNWTTAKSASATIITTSGVGRVSLPNGLNQYAYGVGKETAQPRESASLTYQCSATNRNSRAIVGLVCSGSFTNALPANGIYMLIPQNGGSGTIWHAVGGTRTQIGTTSFSFPNTAGTMEVRLKTDGNTVSWKVWFVGGGEPAWETASITSLSTVPNGTVVLGAETTSSSTSAGISNFDNLVVEDVASPLVDISVNATPLEGSGVFVDPSVIAEGNVSTTVDIMDGSGALNDATFSSTRNFDDFVAGVMTGDGVLNEVTTDTNVRYASEDTNLSTDGGDGVGNYAGTEMVFSSDVPGYRYALVRTPFDTDRAIEHADLVLNSTLSSGSVVLGIGRATSNWLEETATWNNRPSAADVEYFTVGGTGEKVFDVTSIVQNWQDGVHSDYGFVIFWDSGGQIRFNTSEAATLENRPKLVLALNDGNSVNEVLPMEGSMELVEPDTGTHTEVVASVLTGSGLLVDPEVTTTSNPDVLISVGVLEGSGDMPGGFFSVPTVNEVQLMEGAGELLEATAGTEMNAIINPSPLGATGMIPPVLLEINGEIINPGLANDPYYAQMLATTDTDDFWYRLEETSGSVIHDARGDALKDADLFGTYNFGVYGPEVRRSMHFENGYFKRRWATDGFGQPQGQAPQDDSDTDTFAFEVVLRTTDGNGILAYGLDRANPTFETGPIPYFRNAIYLKDGKVTANWNYPNRTDGAFELSGLKNVADGQWHHIVVAFNYGAETDLNSGLRIYIDGKLDIRRRRDVVPGLWASPDSYFGMPEDWRNLTTLYPWQKNFTGDVMEVAFRYEDWLVQDEVNELYYATFGIIPIRATPMIGYGEMPQPAVKGNRKRALVLYVKWNAQGLFTRIGDERNAPSSYSTTVPDEFDHDINIGRQPEPGENAMLEFAGYRVEAASIMREDADPSGPYRDPVTDLPRLLNLQEDVNLDNYDLLVFRNWPDEGADQEVFYQRGYTKDDIEDFLASVKQAVVDGKSLEITNIALASSLGLISGAKAIPMAYDRTGFAEKDLRSALLNPWDNDKSGDTYLDTHANNWHRVTATIENLTDIADTEALVEATVTYNSGTNGDVNNKWAYKLRPGSLQIGDEIMSPAVWWNRILSYTNDGVVTLRPWDKYLWAVTPDGLNVGTPIYRFNNTMYEQNTAVDNPYKNYIGGAVVQRGDSWGGVRIAGKVFMNFAEPPQLAVYQGIMDRQIVPDNDSILNPADKEDAAKRAWDYSYSRVAFSAQGAVGTDQGVQIQQQEDGSFVFVKMSGRGGSVVGINITEKYPTEQVFVPTWALRGLAWLAVEDEVPAGSVIVRPTAMEGTGTIPEPAVVAQRSVTISTTPMLARGVMVAPQGVTEPDVTILPFPMEGSGSMNGYNKTINAEPMLGSGEMVDNFDLISAQGEQVVVFLHGLKEVEIYLNEGVK